MLVYLFATQLALRKVGFFGALLFLLLFAGSNLFAYQQKSTLENRNGAIVIAPSVNVKKTPDMNRSDDFVLHEGTRVNVTDRSMKQWRGIRLDDGREGWLLTNQIEDI